MRVRAETLPGDGLPPEVIELVGRQASLEEGPGVDPRRRMALVVDLVTGLGFASLPRKKWLKPTS